MGRVFGVIAPWLRFLLVPIALVAVLLADRSGDVGLEVRFWALALTALAVPVLLAILVIGVGGTLFRLLDRVSGAPEPVADRELGERVELERVPVVS